MVYKPSSIISGILQCDAPHPVHEPLNTRRADAVRRKRDIEFYAPVEHLHEGVHNFMLCLQDVVPFVVTGPAVIKRKAGIIGKEQMEGFVYCGIPQVVERRYVLFAFEARDELYPYDGMAGRSIFLHLSPVILRLVIHTILQNPEPAASENLVLASLEHAEKPQADGVRQTASGRRRQAEHTGHHQAEPTARGGKTSLASFAATPTHNPFMHLLMVTGGQIDDGSGRIA